MPTKIPLLALLLALGLTAVACSGGPRDTAPLRLAGAPAMPIRAGGGSPFDLAAPTISHLDPGLLHALEAAGRDALADGVHLAITSGWRSRAHQQRLFDEAVARYGSEEEARRYVATPDTSEHVTGDAVDVGPAEADAWLSQHGAAYGLCQIYANEIWHFELATTPGGTCPAPYADGLRR